MSPFDASRFTSRLPQTRCNEDLNTKLKEVADQAGVSVSVLHRVILRRALKLPIFMEMPLDVASVIRTLWDLEEDPSTKASRTFQEAQANSDQG